MKSFIIKSRASVSLTATMADYVGRIEKLLPEG